MEIFTLLELLAGDKMFWKSLPLILLRLHLHEQARPKEQGLELALPEEHVLGLAPPEELVLAPPGALLLPSAATYSCCHYEFTYHVSICKIY